MDKLSHSLPESIGKPAIRALLDENINSLEQVSKLSDAELLNLHGVGPKAVRILREAAKGF